MARLSTLRHPISGDVLDQGLIVHFEGPATATGEDIVEWHCHGGQAVVRALLSALADMRGRFALREALPGEFTRRAFENGRIDFNEAEGLADLLAAETETQRRSALLMAEGHFSRRLEGWRNELLLCAALTESLLDFSDEDDVPESGAESGLRARISELERGMRDQLHAPSAERLNEGIRVVLAGPPNAGKSTLLNALAGREAAIVSDIAGTTRDRIDVPVSLSGVAFTLTDTAGLAGQSSDAIELIGIDRARAAIEQADILLWLGEVADCPRGDGVKIAAQRDRSGWTMPDGADIALSAATGEGLAGLIDRLLERAAVLIPADGEFALHQRQRDGVTAMADALAEAHAAPDLLLLAEYLRRAMRAMDGVTGRAGVEDMLDSLFGRFCIGK